MPNTKIVATIGPASFKEDVLRRMYSTGLSSIRINTAHVESGYIKEVRKIVDGLNRGLNRHVSILVDLKGPELRTGTFRNGILPLKTGMKLRADLTGEAGDITFSHREALDILEPRDIVLLSDGRIRMRVQEKNSHYVEFESMDDGTLRDRSRVNIPGKFLPIGTLSDRDRQFLREGIESGVELFAQSFVQRKEDVIALQSEIDSLGGDQFIVSKIETKSGFQNIRSISMVSDFIMVARGDLGVELPLKEVAIAQKRIIEEAHNHGVPSIVATQVLESMVNSSSPTRAEVSDVTNAILDNADALMLSEESAVGDYPDLAVKYLSEIAEFVESRRRQFPEPSEFLGNRVAYSIAMASKVIAREIQANAIVTFSKTGNTPKMISAVRPGAPIISVVPTETMANKLSLYSGVEPIQLEKPGAKLDDFDSVLEAVEKKTDLRKGDRVVVTSGAPYFLFGGTNEVRVATIGKFVGRGYPSGKSFRGKISLKPDSKGDILLLKSARNLEFNVFSGFKGVIFLERAGHGVQEDLQEKGIPYLHNTKLLRDFLQGEALYVDGSTGVITA